MSTNSIGPNSGSAFLCMHFSEDENKTWQIAELRGNRESFRSLGIGPTALEEMKVIYKNLELGRLSKFEDEYEVSFPHFEFQELMK